MTYREASATRARCRTYRLRSSRARFTPSSARMAPASRRFSRSSLAPSGRISGRMVLDGQPYAPRSVTEATRRGVGLVFQEITINPSLTVAENIFAGRLARFRRHGLLRRGGLNRAAQALLDSFSAEISVSQPLSALDLGQWKCIEVARALSASPRAVLFDEFDSIPQSSRGRHCSRSDAGA